MKKIIYSLVVMLFMGGIFTSCIENVEPDGVNLVRTGYYDYLEALAQMKKADAQISQAEASYRLALAAVQQGIAAQEQAKAEWMQLMNELQAAQNDEEMAAIQDRLEKAAMQQQIDMAGLQAELAEAQKNLADALRALEIYETVVSSEELQAVNMIKANYDYYAGLLYNYYSDLADDLADYWDFLYDYIADGIIEDAEMEYIVAFLEEKTKIKELELQYAEQAAEFWKSLLEDFAFDYLAQARAYKDSADAMASEFADLLRDSVIFHNTYDPILANALAANQQAFNDSVAPLKKKFDEAVKKIKDNVDASGVSADLMKGEAKAKKFPFEFKKSYLIPEHPAGDLITAYEYYLGPWYNYLDPEVEFVFGGRDTLKVAIAKVDKKEDYLAKVDSVWSGSQQNTESIEMSTGLWSAYEDFSREYLYDMDLASIKDDAEALEAYRDSLQDLYDSILNILKSAKDNQGDILLKAWYDKVSAIAESIDDLIDAVKDDINWEDDPENDVYSYTDNDTYHNVWGATFDGPIALYRQQSSGEYWQMPRKVSVDATDPTSFTLEYNSDKYFTGAHGILDLYMTIAPTAADSTKVFNDILNFFKAVAAVDEEAVPYLKFITATNDGATFEVQKVRADKMEFKGLQMKATDTYLKEKGLYQASTYDNKAIETAGATPDVEEYYDAFSNVIELFLHYVEGTTLYNNLYDEEDAAYSFSASGLEDYFDFVEWYYNNNYEVKHFGAYGGFDSPAFKKYSAKSDEGKALYNWLEACAIYYGEGAEGENFGAFAEKVFFTKKTFTEPTMAVVFTGIPKYYKNTDGSIAYVSEIQDIIYHYTSQYGFIVNSIENNLEEYEYDGWEPFNYCMDMEHFSLVFKLLKADYLVYVANNAETFNTLWAKLGEVLQQVKADMDKVVTDNEAKVEKSKADAATYNAALKEYRDAVKVFADAKEAADKEAQDAYDAAYEEIMQPITDRFEEMMVAYNFYNKMYADLLGAYEMHSGYYLDNPQEFIDYLTDMYEDWMMWCADLAGQIEEVKILLYGIDDPTLDAIEEMYWEVIDILDGMDQDRIEDIMFWYEYWKAAYENAIEMIQSRD